MIEEMVIAFIMVFAAGDMGSVEKIQTQNEALQVCQKYYPKGEVKPLPPVVITSPMADLIITTPHVWACMRPMTKEEKEQEETTPDVDCDGCERTNVRISGV